MIAAIQERNLKLKKLPAPGGHYLGQNRCSFCVWAPLAQHVELVLSSPSEQTISLNPMGEGYYATVLDGIAPGTRYAFRLNGGNARPDPASRYQPGTVHEPSEIIDPQFPWTDQHWGGVPLQDYVLYELHVGTATPEGTFEALSHRLDYFKQLGVTALELMPVAQFPGTRNWGYDGVLPFAVQNSYGGPVGLKQLVNACHLKGLAVVLDVVYNHFGPEGNYLREFGHYFTARHHTPWGDAINFDGRQNIHVRRFFIENALQWQRDFHIDALRLDAVHAIVDNSAIPFLQELARATHQEAARSGRRFYLVAESDLNDPRLIRPEVLGGLGLDAQWADDFHHVLHVLLTGERDGYYADFGGVEQLAKAFEQGLIYDGEYSSYRERRHGSPAFLTSPKQFVVYSQNHDQIGNRLLGERLGALTDLEGLKLAAATVLLSPFIPLLFMGEEYAESAPFQYFVSHSDEALREAVRKGRQKEFADFNWKEEMPDPCAESALRDCILQEPRNGRQQSLLNLYRELLSLRKNVPAIQVRDKQMIQALPFAESNVLAVNYGLKDRPAWLVMNFNRDLQSQQLSLGPGKWVPLLDTAALHWGGPGSLLPASLQGDAKLNLQPRSCVLLEKQTD